MLELSKLISKFHHLREFLHCNLQFLWHHLVRSKILLHQLLCSEQQFLLALHDLLKGLMVKQELMLLLLLVPKLLVSLQQQKRPLVLLAL
jgi:hypothetical protein